MKFTVTLPPLAGDSEVAIVAEWRKSLGEVVREGETLATVRIADTPPIPVLSPAYGLLTRRSALVGEAIEVGEPLAVLSGVPESAFTASIVPETFAEPDYVPEGQEESVPLSVAERLQARHNVRTWRDIPHVQTVAVADVTDVLRLIERVGRGETVTGEAMKLDLLPFILHAVANTLPVFPNLNARFVDDTERRIRRDIRLAVSRRTPSGVLLYPVIRDADRRSVLALTRELTELNTRLAAGTLQAEDVRGATFTVTQASGYVLYQTPLLHQPQVAHLSFGTIVGNVVHLCLAHDARAVSPDEASRFLEVVTTKLAEGI